MSGIIGIAANSTGRYIAFTICITSLRVPPNTSIQWAIGSDRVVGRNKLVKAALASGAEWLFFLDDDHAFEPDILLRLLAHEKPIVASLYLQRIKPFSPIAYEYYDDENRTYTSLDLTKYEKNALVPIVAAGTGGMLIRSEVFRELKEPWFEVTEGIGSEDLPFCKKALEAGFEIFCDLGTPLGHIDPVIIWPSYFDEEKEWGVGFNLGDDFNLYIPVEKPISKE